MTDLYDTCRNGHQRTYANTRIRTGSKQGTVLCRICARESTRRRRASGVR